MPVQWIVKGLMRFGFRFSHCWFYRTRASAFSITQMVLCLLLCFVLKKQQQEEFGISFMKMKGIFSSSQKYILFHQLLPQKHGCITVYHNCFDTPQNHSCFKTPQNRNCFDTPQNYNCFDTPQNHAVLICHKIILFWYATKPYCFDMPQSRTVLIRQHITVNPWQNSLERIDFFFFFFTFSFGIHCFCTLAV